MSPRGLVTVTTLGALAVEFGEPIFVKVDTEGYELEVLKGMSFRPRALSLEFHAEAIDLLADCLGLLDGYQYRLRIGNDYRLVNGVD